MIGETESVITVAGLMALAARTAPKAVGIDSIQIEILTGDEQKRLGNEMIHTGEVHGQNFFVLNGEQVIESDATVIIGVKGLKVMGINCGGCGYSGCSEMTMAVKEARKNKTPYTGPNCVFKVTDLGIAIGSAVKTASIHNVDNRIMYSAGVVAMQLGYLKECSMAYGIPLKASGKNIYFDRNASH